MKRYKVNIGKDELKELKLREKSVVNPKLLKRLQAIRLKEEGKTNQELSKFFQVCAETITSWIKNYNNGGIEGLLHWNYKGKVSQLTDEQICQLKKRNEDKPFEFAKEAKAYIEEEFKIAFSLHYVQKLLKKNFDCHIKKQD